MYNLYKTYSILLYKKYSKMYSYLYIYTLYKQLKNQHLRCLRNAQQLTIHFPASCRGQSKGARNSCHISRYGAFSFGKHGFCYTKTRPAGRLAQGLRPHDPQKEQTTANIETPSIFTQKYTPHSGLISQAFGLGKGGIFQPSNFRGLGLRIAAPARQVSAPYFSPAAPPEEKAWPTSLRHAKRLTGAP